MLTFNSLNTLELALSLVTCDSISDDGFARFLKEEFEMSLNRMSENHIVL